METKELELQIESLTRQLEEVKTAYETISAGFDGVKEALSVSEKQSADRQTRIEELESELETVNAVNEELQAEIEKLTAPGSIKAAADQAAAVVVPSVPAETFEIDGKKFRFVSPVFTVRGKRVTAQEAMTDESLLAALVASGSGVIVPVLS